MKRIMDILAGSLIFLLMLFGDILTVQADEAIESEVMVLIDISGTMKEYSSIVKACVEWMGLELSNYDAKVTLKTFADPGVVEEICSAKQIIWEDDETGTFSGNKEDIISLSQYKEKAALKGIQFNKAWTDHKGAFENAVEAMEDSHARFKCIVILSDAKLDYDKNKYRNEDEEKAAEKAAEEEFKNAVNEFAKKPGQKVVLIHFGDKWDMFKGCHEATILPGIDLFKSNDIIEEIVGGAGLKSQDLSITPDGSQVWFTLDSDAYRVIFHVRGDDANSYGKNMSIRVTREGDGKIVKEYDHSHWEGLNLFFYSNLPQGRYAVALPEGEWECEATVRRKILNYDVKVSIEQNQDNIPQQSGVYNITSENFTLNIQVKADRNNEGGDEHSDEMNFLEIDYSIRPVENGQEDDSLDEYDNYKSINSGYNEGSCSFKQEIDLNNVVSELSIGETDSGALNGEYECQIRIRQGDEVCYESKPIIIKADISPSDLLLTTTPSPSDELLEESIIIGDKVDVRTVFQVPDDGMKYYIALNDVKKIELGKKEATVENLNYEDGELSFTKEGHYIISVVSEGGISTGSKIEYDVEPKCWLLRWLDSLF